MGNYTWLDGRGSDDTRYLQMLVYPNTSAERDECKNGILDALRHFGDQLYDANSITKYNIYFHEDEPYLYSPDASTFFDNFDQWLTDSGHDKYYGAHLGVSDNWSGGLAWGSDYHGGTAFSIAQTAVAGSGTSASYYKNTAIQEVGHTIINNNLSEVEAMLTDNNDEHELGKIYSSNYASPMTSGYGVSTSQYGDCASTYDYYSETTYATRCTDDAVYYTAVDENS